MVRVRIPDDILSSAHERAAARAARDWAEADRLRAVIEAAGWKIVDRGTDFALSVAAPPDVAEGDRVRYGVSTSVPARFEDADIGLATVVLIATDQPDDLDRAIASLRTFAPEGTSIVIVADGPATAQSERLEALTDPIETVWTSERLGHGAAMNIGLRRALGPVVILLDTSIEVTGDAITPLVRALDDQTVAVVGGWGITTRDLRRFDDAPAGDVDAIDMNRASARFVDTGDDVQQRAFSRTRLPHDGNEFTGFDLNAYAIERSHADVAHAVDFGQVDGFNDCFIVHY